jgi:hypothetical protein
MPTVTLDRTGPSTDMEIPRIRVHQSDNGGWDLPAIADGRVARTEHCADWHRVERRRAMLEDWLRPELPDRYRRST